jgi:hypothetical protein
MMMSPIHAENGSSNPNVTGSYDGDISILYYYENWSNHWLTNADHYSIAFAPNTTNSQSYVFSANSIEIRAYDMVNGTGSKIIANNDTAKTNITNALRVAQEFSVDTLCSIYSFHLYLEYQLVGRFILRATITEADLETPIDVSEWWVYGGTFSGWRTLSFWSNVLEPGKTYYLLYEVEPQDADLSGPGAINLGNRGNNTWRAELYNNSIYNQGQTLKSNSSTWIPVQNDSQRDMLCYFDYNIIIDPYSVDLQIQLNNQTCPWQRRMAPGGGGYEAYYSTNFPIPPIDWINVTYTMNTTLPAFTVEQYIRYIYLVPAFGWFNATQNAIDWTIIYPYKYVETMVMFFVSDMFAFEYDWDYVEFRDLYDIPMTNVYFGPVSFYNKSYYAALMNLFGPWLEPGNYTGYFTSPNYCHSISAKQEQEAGFQVVADLELGKTARIEASILDTTNNPVSGGNATISITNSLGAEVYTETNITALNGLLSTSEFDIGSTFAKGTYTITVFWSNGHEIGFFSYEIEVVPPFSMTPYYILLGAVAGVAIVSVPLITYTRRKLQQRNWEKHLHNLFILTKDGRSIYGYSFGIEIQDPSLVSAALVAISSFVTDAVKSKKALRVIDLQDRKVILSHGEHTTTALIADKDFPVIIDRTEAFTQAFEKRYGGKVANWRGDTKAFKGVDALIQDYFPVSMDERITRGVKLKLIETQELLQTAEDPLVIIRIMKDVTTLLSRYREIIEQYYMQDYSELIKAAEEKMNTISF